jgi:hypothetical protein
MTQPAAKTVTAAHPATETETNNQNRFPGALNVPLRTPRILKEGKFYETSIP